MKFAVVILAAFLVGTQCFVIRQGEQSLQSRVKRCAAGPNGTVCYGDFALARDSVVSLQEGQHGIVKRNANDEQEQAMVQDESSHNFARVKRCVCPRDHVCDCPTGSK